MATVVLVSGASGLIGSAVVRALELTGSTVRRLVRRAPRTAAEVMWNPESGTLDASACEGVDTVVHLAGESIGKRWTATRRRQIRESRVNGTALLARVIAGTAPDRRPRTMISASAVGFYGDGGDRELDESSPAGTGFLADVCREWEASTAAAQGAGVRVVHLRSGVVLSHLGGALPRMMMPFRFGLGGRLGSGRQWMSWIALEDMVRAIELLIVKDGVSGPVNVVAPNPVTNAELTRAIAQAVHMPALFPVPSAVLRLAFGQMADEALLASQRARPRRLLELGMDFAFPTVERALATTR